MRPKYPHSQEQAARCGRCADILPEQTLTYCPACGVTFSEVPATQSYELFIDRFISLTLSRERKRWALVGVLGFCFFFLLHFFITTSEQKKAIQNLSTLIRPLDIYVFDFQNTPQLKNSIKRQSLGMALQSFEDHFGFTIKNISYRESKLPPVFQDLMNKQGYDLNTLENQMTNLSFWEKHVYLPLTRIWQQDPLGPLPVLITNLPLYADDQSSSEIETRHLGKGRLISGLGHPAFVLISTYRLHPQNEQDRQDSPPVSHDSDRARFLGEFILAHELGHALLSLPDYIEPTTNMRSPASQSLEFNTKPLTQTCLMHTDAGGGFQAWSFIRNRKLGQNSECQEYSATQKFLDLREKAVQELKAGRREWAQELHQEALAQLSPSSENWLTQLVQKEQILFSSSLRYWTHQFFMVE